MTRADWKGVCDGCRTAAGLFWPIPITLSAPKSVADPLKLNSDAALTDPDSGEILATLPLDEMLRDALLNGRGQLGTLLAAAEAIESGDTAVLQRAAEALALPSFDPISAAQLEALRWAQTLATGEMK